MADNKTQLKQKDRLSTIKKESKPIENFASLVKGISPIKRKSQTINRFDNQANFLADSVLKNTQSKKSHNWNKLSVKANPLERTDSLNRGDDNKFKSADIYLKNETYPKVLANDRLEYRDFSVSHKQMRALKAGKIKPKKVVDLHGMNRIEASEFVSELITNYSNCSILIIHGKGYNSSTGEATLKSWLNYFLKQESKVRAFSSAPISEGGTGACLVWLK